MYQANTSSSGASTTLEYFSPMASVLPGALRPVRDKTILNYTKNRSSNHPGTGGKAPGGREEIGGRVAGRAGGMQLREAAEALGVHYQTVYGWVRQGTLPARKTGRGYEVARPRRPRAGRAAGLRYSAAA